MGGLAVPNINDFWDGLKVTWLNRLAEAPDTAKWKKLALRDLKGALRKPQLNCSNIVEVSPLAIAEASSRITNKFWGPIWAQLPKLVNAHNKLMGEAEFLEEKILWGTSNFLDEAGVPLNTRKFQPKVVEVFKTVGDAILKGEVNKVKVAELESEKEIAQFKELLNAISRHLVKIQKTWNDITRADHGPYHRGWSRLRASLKKSRDVYRLIQRDRRDGESRNENEQKLQIETNITTMTERRWNSVYKNLSLLKCNLRIKYEEWRIAWGRQELNRDKRHYPGCTTQSTKCSYCNISVETEHHIYTACPRLEQFWIGARSMVYLEWGILVPLNLKCSRLFGMEMECHRCGTGRDK